MFTVLSLIFIILKLTEVIAWSWFWVLFPILVDLGLSILLMDNILQKLKDLYFINSVLLDGLDYEEDEEIK